jgi:hypothetical protein
MAIVYHEFSAEYETLKLYIEQCLHEIDSINKGRINKNINNNVPHTFNLTSASFSLSKDNQLTKEEFDEWLDDVESILSLNGVFLAYDHNELKNFDRNRNYFKVRSRIYEFDVVPYCTIEEYDIVNKNND